MALPETIRETRQVRSQSRHLSRGGVLLCGLGKCVHATCTPWPSTVDGRWAIPGPGPRACSPGGYAAGGQAVTEPQVPGTDADCLGPRGSPQEGQPTQTWGRERAPQGRMSSGVVRGEGVRGRLSGQACGPGCGADTLHGLSSNPTSQLGGPAGPRTHPVSAPFGRCSGPRRQEARAAGCKPPRSTGSQGPRI